MKRLHLITGAGVALMAIWYLLVFVPGQKKLTATREEASALKAQIDNISLTVAQLPQILKTRAALDSALSRLREGMYSRDELLGLFADCKRLAADHRLRLIEIAPPVDELIRIYEATRTDTLPQFLHLTLKLRGDYMAIGRFSEALENAPFFRGIVQTQLAGQVERPGPIDATIGFKAMVGEIPEAS